jgi:putative transposase
MMTEKIIHHRRSIRLEGYDYASEGGYFITVVAHNRKCLFGSIRDDEMRLNEFGRIVRKEWFHTAKLRPNIELFEDEFVVMPNHIHGIIWITDFTGRDSLESITKNDPIHVGAYSHTPLQSPSRTIGAIIRGFKGAVTTKINISRGGKGVPVWQRNYYDPSHKERSGAHRSRHIINSEKDHDNIAKYIDSNPIGWQTDKEYLEAP